MLDEVVVVVVGVMVVVGRKSDVALLLLGCTSARPCHLQAAPQSGEGRTHLFKSSYQSSLYSEWPYTAH